MITVDHEKFSDSENLIRKALNLFYFNFFFYHENNYTEDHKIVSNNSQVKFGLQLFLLVFTNLTELILEAPTCYCPKH